MITPREGKKGALSRVRIVERILRNEPLKPYRNESLLLNEMLKPIKKHAVMPSFPFHRVHVSPAGESHVARGNWLHSLGCCHTKRKEAAKCLCCSKPPCIKYRGGMAKGGWYKVCSGWHWQGIQIISLSSSRGKGWWPLPLYPGETAEQPCDFTKYATSKCYR